MNALRRRHVQPKSGNGLGDRFGYIVAHLIGLAGYRDSDDLSSKAIELLPHEKAGLAPSAEGRDDHAVEPRRPAADLLSHLLGARSVPQRADLCGPALGDHVRGPPSGIDFSHQTGEQVIGP